MRKGFIAWPAAAAAAGLTAFFIASCSNSNFSGGSGKLAGNDKKASSPDGSDTGTPDNGTPKSAPIPFTKVQSDCQAEITKFCAKANNVSSCLQKNQDKLSAACKTTFNNYRNQPTGGTGTGTGTGGTVGAKDGKDGGPVTADGGKTTPTGTDPGIAADGGGTLTLHSADLVLNYSAYTDGDGNDKTATMTFFVKGPNDKDYQPVNVPPMVSQQAASGSTRIKGACKCGAITTFSVKWHAEGGLGAFDGQVENDDALMWLMSHNAPGQPDSGRDTHWSDDATGAGGSGPNVMYMSEDHPAAGGAPCSVPYFYCGTHSSGAACPDHPWDCMDDIRMRWSCDTSACADQAAGTGLDITGSAGHTLDPVP